jgi:hypothetical protein
MPREKKLFNELDLLKWRTIREMNDFRIVSDKI